MVDAMERSDGAGTPNAASAGRPTIADVARHAGVSKGRVSFALNDRPGVAPDTRARILEVAEELGWTPEPTGAVAQRRASPSRCGLVIGRSPDVIAADPFFHSLIAGIEDEFSTAGQVLVLAVATPGRHESVTYRGLAEDKRVDGVILTDLRAGDDRIALVRELGLAAVTLGVTDGDSPFSVGVGRRRRGRPPRGAAPRRARAPPDRARRGSRRPCCTPSRRKEAFDPGDARMPASTSAGRRRPTSAPARGARPPRRCFGRASPDGHRLLERPHGRGRSGRRAPARPERARRPVHHRLRRHRARPLRASRPHERRDRRAGMGRRRGAHPARAVGGETPVDVRPRRTHASPCAESTGPAPTELRGIRRALKGEHHETTNHRGGRRRGIGLLALTACGGGGGGGSADDMEATGDITIWYSNNEAEIAWGEADGRGVERRPPRRADQGAGDPRRRLERGVDHRRDHRRQRAVPRSSTPRPPPCRGSRSRAGSSTCPSSRTATTTSWSARGDIADQYRSEDGDFYQLPWKSNPVMIFYNKDMFTQAGLDPENPALSTYDEFLETSRTLVQAGVADYAINPSPTSEFFQPWFDFYPLYAAQTGGTLLVEDGAATFDDENGAAVANFWRTMYDEGSPATRRTRAIRSPTASRPCRSWGRGPSPCTATRSTGAPCRCRRKPASRRRRPTRSATRRTSASTPRARTRARRGRC